MRENRLSVNPSHGNGRSSPLPDSKADCPVPAGLPRDIRVEADEPRITNDVPFPREAVNEFSRKKGRAHPTAAVRVVDSDPKDHRVAVKAVGRINRPLSPNVH